MKSEQIDGAGIERVSERLRAVEQALRQVLADELRQDGAGSVRAEHTRIALAANLGDQKRFAEAEVLANQAAAHYQGAFGPDHRQTIQARYALGNLYFQEGHYPRAAAWYGDLYQQIGHTSRFRQALAVRTGLNQALALRLTGQTAEAAPLLRTSATDRA